MSWKSFLKEYFSFSRRERYGVLVLCGCILLILTVKWMLPHLIKRQVPDTTAYEKEITLFRQAADSVSSAKNQIHPLVEESQSGVELFYFDPNTTTDEDWERLGLTQRQIRNIRNYQEKGGHFKEKEDFLKLYTISMTQYKTLEPYIQITSNTAFPKQSVKINQETQEFSSVSTTSQKDKSICIELNSVDSAVLTRLNGIGPVLASRIVKYRTLLGGFVHVTQLNEVYGIKPEVTEKLMPQLSIDDAHIRKIPMNTATLREFTRHPYINEQQARGILKYRQLQGSIHHMDELVKNHILTQEEVDKLVPYISFEE